MSSPRHITPHCISSQCREADSEMLCDPPMWSATLETTFTNVMSSFLLSNRMTLEAHSEKSCENDRSSNSYILVLKGLISYGILLIIHKV